MERCSLQIRTIHLQEALAPGLILILEVFLEFVYKNYARVANVSSIVEGAAVMDRLLQMVAAGRCEAERLKPPKLVLCNLGTLVSPRQDYCRVISRTHFAHIEISKRMQCQVGEKRSVGDQQLTAGHKDCG